MARRRTIPKSGKTVLIIDDNVEYLESTKRIVERDGHRVLTAPGGADALALLSKTAVDLVLVDYFMPGMTGEEFVSALRRFDSCTQVILQTGYASEQPPREMLRRLDIQGYHDKSEGPDKLCLWIDVGLKSAYTLQLLQKSRLGLRYILGVTPELHRLQALDQLLQGILLQTAGLLGAVDSFVAVVTPGRPNVTQEGFLALVHDGGEVTVRAATGRYQTQPVLDAERSAALHRAFTSNGALVESSYTVVPLRIGSLTLGAIYLDRATLEPSDVELMEIFANQAAVAIHNMELYQGAALDPLTSTYTRRFFEQALQRDLRSAYRTNSPLGLLMVDVDAMKQINDAGGHLAGDRALATTGRLLRQAIRANDIVGRYGGDEFAVLLPGADPAGVKVVAERVAKALGEFEIETASGSMRIAASIGAAALVPSESSGESAPRDARFFAQIAEKLIGFADGDLYRQKGREHAMPDWETADPPAIRPVGLDRAS